MRRSTINKDPSRRPRGGAYHIEHREKGYYLTAKFNGELISERISGLDHGQYENGVISDSDLIHKYMAYLSVD